MTDRVEVAVFDVDGTLTVRDCVRPFLERVGGRVGIARALLRRPVASIGAAVRRDRDLLKAIVVGGVLRGRDVTEVEALGQSFASDVRDGWLRTDTLARLQWHQAAGHRTALVSASLGPYLRPLGQQLGVDAVLCTEPLLDGDRYGDGLDGANCRAAEKVRRLDAWLGANGLRDAAIWAYGDSRGDRELLARADHSLLVKDLDVPAVPAGFVA